MQVAAPVAAAAATPSKVANIREPEVAIEQPVMNTLRSTLASPAPAAVNGLNEVAQSLTAQIAQLQSQAAQLQTRIDEEQVAAQTHTDLNLLSDALAQQAQRIDALGFHGGTGQGEHGGVELGIGFGLGQPPVQASELGFLAGEEGFEFALVVVSVCHSANLARIFANA